MDYQLTDIYLSGNVELDALHQKAIHFLNALLNQCDASYSYECNAAFYKCQSAFEKHFNYELELMQKTNFPDMEEHCRQHSQIRKSLAFYREQNQQLGAMGNESLVENIIQSVGDPFMNHIRTLDRELAEYVQNNAREQLK